MRVLVCPDKFAGTLSAVEAAAAIARGWTSARPADDVLCMPLADGGPGFVEVLHANLGGTLHEVQVADPLGRLTRATWLEHDATAYLEAAQANGLDLVSPQERDLWSASTAGVGQMIADALPLPIVIGLGGSGTNDGGRDAFEAVGHPVPRLTIATDVDCPLLGPKGATYGFARQKGAREQDLAALEARMVEWAEQNVELAEAPGAGAAGGLGYGLMLLGGQRVSGIGLVAEAVGLAAACAEADLVISGEGKLDWQSLHGKVLSGVRDVAPALLVLAGQVETDAVDARSLLDFAGDRALSDPAGSLAGLAQEAARTW